MRNKQNSLSRRKRELLHKSLRAAKSIGAVASPEFGKVSGIYDAVYDTSSAANAFNGLMKAYGRAGKQKIKRHINKTKKRIRRLYS